MTTKWTQSGNDADTGNGAIISTSRSAAYPSVIRWEFRSYCGREKDETWYEIDGDPERRRFATPARAEAAASQLRAQPTAALEAELRRRGVSVS